MNTTAKLPFYGVAILAALFSCATSTWAQTITNIPTPYQNTGTLYGEGDWANNPYNSSIGSAPTTGNTGTGINFTDWAGHYEEVGPQGTFTLSFSPVALGNASTVNTLMNTFYGIAGQNAVITFENSNGDTESYDLISEDTIRDYNQNVYTNDLLGGSEALEGVTAETWYTSSAGQGFQRFDVQTFYLPSDWAGTSLVSMTIFDSTGSPGNTGDNPDPDILLSALQVDSANSVPISATPEPSSLALLGTGALGLAGMVRRRLGRKN